MISLLIMMKIHYLFEPDTLPKGVLEVTFNPVILKGITPEEIGRRDTNLKMIKNTMRKVYVLIMLRKHSLSVMLWLKPLRLPVLDPIRHLYLNEVELMQDRDYTIDMRNREIVFINSDNSDTSVLHTNDIVEVNYTPDISDDSLTLAFLEDGQTYLKMLKLRIIQSIIKGVRQN